MQYDYNKPAKIEDFQFVSYEDNGRQRQLRFKYDEKYFDFKYKYGAGYGFSFVTEYENKLCFENPLSTTGSRIIYSSTLDCDCTDLGRYLEYSLVKIGHKRIKEILVEK